MLSQMEEILSLVAETIVGLIKWTVSIACNVNPVLSNVDIGPPRMNRNISQQFFLFGTRTHVHVA